MFRTPLTWRVAVALILALPAVCSAVGESVNGFPSWEERVLHEWTNRARSAPQVEMAACGANCAVDASCYSPIVPLSHDLALNRSARFHADETRLQNYSDHPSACTVVSNINSLNPAACDGSGIGETMASGSADPNAVFYLWMREAGTSTSCSFTLDKPHRWLILKEGVAIGGGFSAALSVMDFGDGSAPTKVPSGAHCPRQFTAVDIWAASPGRTPVESAPDREYRTDSARP